MNTPIKKSVLFLCRHAPYGSSHAHETLDMAMAFAVFEQPVSMLFLGSGCLQLREQSAGDNTGVKNLAAAIKALPLYDVDNIYCDRSALSHYGLSEQTLCIPAESLDDAAMKALIEEHDLVLSV